jgi:hypothetical protein
LAFFYSEFENLTNSSFLFCRILYEHGKQPMSKKTKQYILNLDIDMDARILRERLNICSDALDYFYASSSILKAGAKAGLSLYEIAIMCCRNDDLGEVPSKLEVLFGMAGDLAESAIRNDRWGHAAASRALAEQLSPHGGSLLTPCSNKNGFGRRAASAFDLNELAALTGSSNRGPAADRNMPSMIQSAGSDSSSDSGDVEREDCEEWAAELIKNVTMDTSSRLLNTKTRSPSIESDGSNDSPGGFWQKSPGSLDDFSCGSEEDESVNWSPVSSPSREILEGSYLHDSRMSYNPYEPGRRSSLCFNEDLTKGPDESMEYSFRLGATRRPSKVSFADLDRLDHEETNDTKDPRFKHSNSDVGENPVDMLVVKKSNMRRCQSYSELSSTIADTVKAEEERMALKRTSSFTEEEYRSYYLKFVDLVIVREVTAASHMKQG